MNDCPRMGKLIRGCKFEPRFDRGAITKDINFTGRGFKDVLKELSPKNYIRDVCIRCGKTIERELESK